MDKQLKTTKVKFIINYDEYKKGLEYDVPNTMLPFLKGIGLIEKIKSHDTTRASGQALSLSNTELHKHSNESGLEKKKVDRRPANKNK